MEPDYDWIAGRKRSHLPGMALRAIPFAGVALGCGAAYVFSAGLLPCIMIGATVGMAAYQIAAHKLQP